MPHRVPTFLRQASGHVHTKKTTTASSSPSRHSSPYASDGEDHSIAVKLPDLADALKKHHRLSLPFAKSSKGHHGSHHGRHSPMGTSAVAVDCSVESPPIVFHGNPQDSTGALVSGQMILNVKDEVVEVDSFNANLNIHITQKRPFHNHCSECQNQYTEVKSWQLLAHPTVLRRGIHQFPFSVLLPGHLPASMDTPVLSIAYEFKAEALVVKSPASGALVPIKYERTFHVKRSIPEPDLPHHSIRVFPPTNIKASAHYSAVIRPNGVNKVTLKLDGLITHNERVKTVDMWRLKKLTWRLEETIKTIAPACKAHTPAAAPGEESSKKGLPRSEIRVLGEKHIHDGWKSDFSGTDGTVDFEFDYHVDQIRPNGREVKLACDAKSQDGTEVSHSLVVEMIVSKEYAPVGKPQLATQTGTGRILRMHYAVNMTDYPGLGVSWDNESPPVYQDVPPSPPEYSGECPIEYGDLEALDASRRSSLQPLDASSSAESSARTSASSSRAQSRER
ncbi:LDB19 [Paramyrothecium foliicola]|nr:LDB19 [Paramyrothecium foliicola]